MNPHPVHPVTMLFVPDILNNDMFQEAWNQMPVVISARERRLFAPLLRRAWQTREEVFGWLRVLAQEWAENELSEGFKLALWLTIPYVAVPSSMLTENLGYLVDTRVYVHQTVAMPVHLALLRPLWVVEDDDRDACNLASLQCRLEETARNQKRLYEYIWRICGNIVRCNLLLTAGIHMLQQRAQTVRCVGWM